MADATMPGLPAVRNPLEAQPDLLRELVEQTVNALLSAEAEASVQTGPPSRCLNRTSPR